MNSIGNRPNQLLASNALQQCRAVISDVWNHVPREARDPLPSPDCGPRQFPPTNTSGKLPCDWRVSPDSAPIAKRINAVSPCPPDPLPVKRNPGQRRLDLPLSGRLFTSSDNTQPVTEISVEDPAEALDLVTKLIAQPALKGLRQPPVFGRTLVQLQEPLA